MLAEAFRRILVGAGFEVTSCRTGVEALMLLEAVPIPVDVVLSDVQLPVIPGDRLAQEIRRRRPDTPVVLMTGFSTAVTHETASDLDVVAVLQKPLSGRQLVAAIRDAIRTPAHAACTTAPETVDELVMNKLERLAAELRALGIVFQCHATPTMGEDNE